MKISGVDKEKVLQMLQKEYECTHEQAQEKLYSLGKLIPEMWALFEAWCREEAVEYTFQDIILSYIVGKVVQLCGIHCVDESLHTKPGTDRAL